MSATIAAVIVTRNSAGFIEPCLQSLRNVSEVIIVDNASADETCAVVRRQTGHISLIANSENRGFAAAANQGARASSAPFLLFLNPDAAVEIGIESMALRLQTASAGAVSGRLVGSDGKTQAGFNVRRFPTPVALAFEALLINRLWPGNPVNRRYRWLDFDYSREQDVDQPAGAFLMVRRDVLDRVGGWDERFSPLWFEDVDLCLRIRRAGYSIVYTPEAVARHHGAHSLAAISLEERQIYWYRSLLAYAGKHFSSLARFGLRAAVGAGALLRVLGALGQGHNWRIYGKVMGLALARQATAKKQVQPHVLS